MIKQFELIVNREKRLPKVYRNQPKETKAIFLENNYGHNEILFFINTKILLFLKFSMIYTIKQFTVE